MLTLLLNLILTIKLTLMQPNLNPNPHANLTLTHNTRANEDGSRREFGIRIGVRVRIKDRFS